MWIAGGLWSQCKGNWPHLNLILGSFLPLSHQGRLRCVTFLREVFGRLSVPSCAVSFYFLIKFLDFPGSPVVKTLGFQSGGRGFNPWSRNQDPMYYLAKNEKKEKKISLLNRYWKLSRAFFFNSCDFSCRLLLLRITLLNIFILNHSCIPAWLVSAT